MCEDCDLEGYILPVQMEKVSKIMADILEKNSNPDPEYRSPGVNLIEEIVGSFEDERAWKEMTMHDPDKFMLLIGTVAHLLSAMREYYRGDTDIETLFAIKILVCQFTLELTADMLSENGPWGSGIIDSMRKLREELGPADTMPDITPDTIFH